MSYDIYLEGPDGAKVSVRPFMGGGTVMADPETMEEVPQVEAWLNVTYNYSSLFDLAAKAALHDLANEFGDEASALVTLKTLRGIKDEGIRYIGDRQAEEVRTGLERLLAQLDPRGVFRRHDDYWAPTPGNAAAAIRTLVSWCHEAPTATFRVH